mmetsp:Transcript_4722/g.14590  ORF Transcript_4722/g.14590 Transcript_4722/m.14590 type:complete len:287 (+) Transcript_4722:1560-2420(+)
MPSSARASQSCAEWQLLPSATTEKSRRALSKSPRSYASRAARSAATSASTDSSMRASASSFTGTASSARTASSSRPSCTSARTSSDVAGAQPPSSASAALASACACCGWPSCNHTRPRPTSVSGACSAASDLEYSVIASLKCRASSLSSACSRSPAAVPGAAPPLLPTCDSELVRWLPTSEYSPRHAQPASGQRTRTRPSTRHASGDACCSGCSARWIGAAHVGHRCSCLPSHWSMQPTQKMCEHSDATGDSTSDVQITQMNSATWFSSASAQSSSGKPIRWTSGL